MIHLQFFDAGHCHHPEHVVLRNRVLRPMRFDSMFALMVHPTQGAHRRMVASTTRRLLLHVQMRLDLTHRREVEDQRLGHLRRLAYPRRQLDATQASA